ILPSATGESFKMSHPTPDRRNFGLDAMRALAIMLVLLSHSRSLLRRSIEGADEIFALGTVFGYLGVEIFFVLSGFLIGGNLINAMGADARFGDVWDFRRRRWWRTLPACLVWLGVEVALAIALGGLAVALLI